MKRGPGFKPGPRFMGARWSNLSAPVRVRSYDVSRRRGQQTERHPVGRSWAEASSSAATL
jgi:hypothetical protein